MAKAESGGAHRKVLRVESLDVLLVSVNSAGAPAGVDELPGTVGVFELHGVPGVACTVRRNGLARLEGGMAVAFAMASNRYRFQTSVQCKI